MLPIQHKYINHIVSSIEISKGWMEMLVITQIHNQIDGCIYNAHEYFEEEQI